MSGGTGFALPRDVFSIFDRISVGVMGHYNITNPVLPLIVAVTWKCFLARINKFFTHYKKAPFSFSIFLAFSWKFK